MEDIKVWLVKILLPSLVAISIKIAIQSKKEAVTWFNVITSFITGIGSAYLFAIASRTGLDDRDKLFSVADAARCPCSLPNLVIISSKAVNATRGEYDGLVTMQ